MGTAQTRATGASHVIVSAALLLAGLGASSADAATKGAAKRPQATLTLDADGSAEHLRAGTLASFAPGLIDSGKFSFTAPGQGGSNARLATAERAFRFTPSGKVDSRRAFSVGVTSRVVAPAVDTSRAAAVPVEIVAATPVAYNVDLAVGWHNFAVSGGFSRAEAFAGTLPSALAPHREAVDVGLSYRGASWKTSVQVAAESGPPLLLTPLAPAALLDHHYSVEVGGAYLLTPQLSVTGGVKYKATVSPTDPLVRDHSVYLGTAFTF